MIGLIFLSAARTTEEEGKEEGKVDEEKEEAKEEAKDEGNDEGKDEETTMDEAGSFEVVAKELKVLGLRLGRGEPGSAVISFWSSSCGCCSCWAEEEEDVVDDATWFVGPAEMNNMLCCFSVWL